MLVLLLPTPFGYVVRAETQTVPNASQQQPLGVADEALSPTTLDQLDRVPLSGLKLDGAALAEAVNHLARESYFLGPRERQVNILLLRPADGERKVTLNLRDVTLGEAVRRVAASAKLKCSVDKHAVWLVDPLTDINRDHMPRLPGNNGSIVFPEILFLGGCLDLVVKDLSERSVQLDPNKHGVKMVVKGTPTSSVTLFLRDATSQRGYSLPSADRRFTV